MDYRVLVINPGSTSTKIALFEGENRLFQETLRHSAEELAPFAAIMDQVDFRRGCIEKVLAEKEVALDSLHAVCARGGQLPPSPSGAFVVDEDMCNYLYGVIHGAHASNLGCVIAYGIAKAQGIPAYIYDSVAVDEMEDMARITGMPMIRRQMIGHTLNTRAMAMKCAEEILHKPFEDCRFVVCHLGGGCSARLFVGGKMVDGIRDDELMFAPERCGGVAAQDLIEVCFSGKYTKAELMKLVRGGGGLKAHLGTSSAQEVEGRIHEGDAHAKEIYEAMLYGVAKTIGALSAGAGGSIDRIILTGGIAYSKYVTNYLIDKLSFIAPVEVMAGEFEMEALAAGACRVLNGEEVPHTFGELVC